MHYSRVILDFFSKKDLRRILKRKDSDAGERGKALEELRGSFYSRFRSPESAKRQEQQFFGAFTALSFNFVVAISIIFMNKWVLERVGFHFPICLSLIHYATSWFFLAILNSFSMLPASPPSKTARSSLFTLGFVMSLSTGLANVSLKFNSVGFYQMAKIAVTPSIVFLEFIWLRKKVTFPKVVTLTVVSIGVAVATVTDLQFNLFGACVAVAWIIPSAVNKIQWSTLQQKENWTALALMWKTTPITVFFLGTLMPLLDPPGVLSYDWNMRTILPIFTSALLGFLLQWSGALALGATSAISHVVLGQFKTCVLLLGNFYIFDSNPGATSVLGAFVAIGGMSSYTYLNMKGSKSHLSMLSSQKSGMSNLSLSLDNGKNANGSAAESV